MTTNSRHQGEILLDGVPMWEATTTHNGSRIYSDLRTGEVLHVDPCQMYREESQDVIDAQVAVMLAQRARKDGEG